MKISVLGPIEVTVDDEVVSLSPQLRRLLGVLVAAEGRVVTVDRVAMHVADGRVEGSSVRTAVSRLRKIVGDRVEAFDGGYRLVGDELDLLEFEALREQARSGGTEDRIESLSEALSLWRGAAFGDLADEEWAVVAANAAEQSRAGCVEELGEALLETGRYGEAASLLEAFVVEQPYRELPVGLLMRALAGQGRSVEALRVFERFRVGLRDGVGLDPSAELRALEADLLSPDKDIERTVVVEASAESRVGSTSIATGAQLLPEGTVTFLFTDIVGSTQRWQADEAAMAAELAAHDQILRESVATNDGHLFKHTGDGICAVFSSAPAGVAAALAAQEGLELPVRMGLHTGEAELRGGDYYGPTLNRAARIMDAGHGGQVLLSASTASLVSDRELVDLGEHRLKGLDSPERVWQVGTADHAPLRTEHAVKGNLSTDPSPFIGRREELEGLSVLLADHRMVSLIGVGGTGKTRLAVEAARSLAPAFPDGCWLVELAETASAELVPLAISSALGIPDAGAEPMVAVTKLLARKRALLVVDNCEHVLDSAADAVEQIIEACPAVTVLATSREPLMVAVERLAPTPSLSDADAEALFFDRARAEAPDLLLDDAQRTAVNEICRRLDGLPLAIELAAARLRSMTPVEIERRLDERFRLLVGGRRSRVERHRTMAAALDWSYELCDPVEQVVFARLSVFASEFGLVDAVAVAADDDSTAWDPQVDEFAVEDALAQLVDRSLVRRVVGPRGGSKFRLLETMRAYGHQRLVEVGDADHRRRRHAEHVDRVLCALSFQVWGPNEERARADIVDLTPEILLATEWCLDAEEWARVFRLGSACSSASWGTTGEVLAQLAGVAAGNDEVGVALGPLRMAMVDDVQLIFSTGTLDRSGQRRRWPTGEAFAEWFAVQHPLVEDHLGYPPIPMMLEPQHRLAIASYLQTFDGHPSHRWYLGFMLREAALQTFGPDAGSTLPELTSHASEQTPQVEELLELLDSRLARARWEAFQALLLEASGDLEAAADRVANALDGASGRHHSDVVNACRVIRVLARAGRSVTGADIRRPWGWVDANPYLGSAVVPTIFNTAIVLEILGETALALRLLLHIPPTVRRSLPPFMTNMLSAELRLVLDSDKTPTEPLDDIKAEVFRFADTL